MVKNYSFLKTCFKILSKENKNSLPHGKERLSQMSVCVATFQIPFVFFFSYKHVVIAKQLLH